MLDKSTTAKRPQTQFFVHRRDAGATVIAASCIGPLPLRDAGANRAGNELARRRNLSTMADENDIISDLNLNPQPNGEDDGPAAGIISQYIKDLSVESPNSPECFKWQEAPQIDVQFNISAQRVEDEIHEVELKVVVTAKTGEGTAYVVDLSYGGLIGMRHLDDNTAHAFL